jgi:hypothetical protein
MKWRLRQISNAWRQPVGTRKMGEWAHFFLMSRFATDVERLDRSSGGVMPA